MFINIGLVLLLFSVADAADNADIIKIGAFAAEKLQAWQHKQFEGETSYSVILMDGKSVIKAESSASASGLFKKRRIDLWQTPYLNWSWRIKNRLTHLNEQIKSGDDYAARIYIVVGGGWALWNTKAINYVWSGTSPKGKIWPNAFAGKQTMMFAIRSAEDPVTTWLIEKRNVRDDLQTVFGRDFRYIDAIALMTDTDNSQGKATAYYGDIYFSRN